MTSPPTPSPSSVRVTVTVTPEVHEAYKRLAAAGNISLSRAMGEWLGDTIEAAQFMAEKMEQARAAPRIVMQEMHAYALGLADETGSIMDKMREKGRQARAGDAQLPTPATGAPPPPPRLVIRGGKSPKAGKGERS